MPEPAHHADVVIVGAGVSGLSAAHQLNRAGVTTVILEAAPYVGGRMSTEKVDGFRLDRIGQLLSTSYPELRHTPGLDALALRPFAPGLLVHSEGQHHRTAEFLGSQNPRRARGALHAARALASAPRVPRPARTAARTPLRTSRPSARSTPLGSALDQARLGAALARLELNCLVL
ncbi:FAD-dependent oxidoreductase, partial [Streptomyces spectabilis]|uniref:FAD-dependent oxidoreductase n=1 Tax=Streptomyces spectabilis TaxID=68270 RepID=UPI0033D27511